LLALNPKDKKRKKRGKKKKKKNRRPEILGVKLGGEEREALKFT